MKRKTFAAVAAALLVAPLSAQAATSPTTQAKAHAHWFAGAVTSTGSGSLAVDVLWTGKHDTQLDGQQISVAIDSGTQIHYGKGKSSIGQGDLVGIVGTGTDLTSLTAKRINVRCNCHFAAGTLGSVGGSSFAVDVSRTGPYDTVLKGNAVTFQVSGSTVFVQGKDKAAGTLSGLKTGEKVGVIFSATGFFKNPGFNWQTATFTASHVRYAGGLKPAPTNP